MKKLISSLLLLVSTFAMADAPQLNKQFEATTQAIPTDNPAKIEVVELFWYGCIHCYHMDSVLNKWVAKLPKDVYFKRVPGLPNPSWAPMARAYYAMEALGISEKLHTPLFDAVHKHKKLNPTDEKAVIQWITAASKLDKKEVEGAFKSFGMNANLNRAAQFFKASGATAVPSLVIDGKYITSSSMTGGNAQALNTADYIINNVRKDKLKAASKPKK